MRTRILPFFLLMLGSIASAFVAACGDDSSSVPAKSDASTEADASSGATATSGNPHESETADDASVGAATAPTTCEVAGGEICIRACACATDGRCHVGVEVDGAGVATIDFDDEVKCREFYVDVACAGAGEAGFDYGTCVGRVKAASCVDAAGGRAVLFPLECKVSE